MLTIAVFTLHAELETEARLLATQLKLPYQPDADYLLTLTPDYLGLQKTGDKALPLYIDFRSGKLNFRRQNTSLRKEALVRALGLKSQTQPYIIDATTGLARDSFVLASFGFQIQMIERSPIIHALIQDGIKRGLNDPDLAPIVQRMHLLQSDALVWLTELTRKPNIIYLDPMFPERKKSALTKIDMRIFHDVVGDDLDADALLYTALACASERVVVKRPRLAAELANKRPNYSLTGSSSRFDVYLI